MDASYIGRLHQEFCIQYTYNRDAMYYLKHLSFSHRSLKIFFMPDPSFYLTHNGDTPVFFLIMFSNVEVADGFFFFSSFRFFLCFQSFLCRVFILNTLCDFVLCSAP